MNVRLRRVLAPAGLVVAALGLLSPGASAQGASPVVVQLPIDGVVDPFVAGHIEDGIASAEDESAEAVLITLDTPGGLDSSMRQITQAILNARVPVIGFVSPQGARAASAGTFILLSTNIAAMAPATNIGAAQPVGQIIRAMSVGGDSTRLAEIARTEQNSTLRLTAVRSLGIMGHQRTGDTLLQIYNADKDPAVRKAVAEALFIQGNSAALVSLARKEQDAAMKKTLVERLSLMNDKIARDYMLELLK